MTRAGKQADKSTKRTSSDAAWASCWDNRDSSHQNHAGMRLGGIAVQRTSINVPQTSNRPTSKPSRSSGPDVVVICVYDMTEFTPGSVSRRVHCNVVWNDGENIFNFIRLQTVTIKSVVKPAEILNFPLEQDGLRQYMCCNSGWCGSDWLAGIGFADNCD